MSADWQDMLQEQAPAEFEAGALVRDYVVPPFTVLDSRAGYWTERRRRWLSLGIQSELGRGAATGSIPERDVRSTKLIERASLRQRDGTAIAGGAKTVRGSAGNGAARSFRVDLMRGEDGYSYGGDDAQAPAAPGTSIFDPVLAEVAYRWFCPPGGSILDPFAGGSVRGIVAGMLGHQYVGVDLSEPQVLANRAQSGLLPPDKPAPMWHVGDSAQLLDTFPEEAWDMVFTCPPYYDLEVYSDDPRDISALGTYAQFVQVYAGIIAAAARRLRPGRFMGIVIGEVRGADGSLLGLVPDTVAAAQLAGLTWYNDAILVNSAGSLPVRVGQQFSGRAGRKLGRMHQYLLVFAKGEVQAGAWSYEREDVPDPQQGLGW